MSTIHTPSNLQVNTNSLIGRLSLARAESGLTTAIRNLSTGIRIHSGRDDPVGFVTSSGMRTDIVSMSQAVSNCQKASSVISTTDSVLANMGNLLNDLRGLVTQAANTGAENNATLNALQLEADAILNTIDFMANSTSYQDQKLLDGSLDFTTYGVDSNKISLIDINQANFLGRTERDISVQVLEAPQQAELYYPLGALRNDVVLDIGGTGGYQTFSFSKNATVNDIADMVNRYSDATGVAATVYSQSTAGSLGLTSYGKNNDIILTASKAGSAEGNFVVKYTAPKEGNENLSLNVTQGSGNEPTEIEVILQTELWKKAEYHYNGENDGISDNEFTIAAKYAGKEFNDIRFEFENVYGTDKEPGIELDMQASPKVFRINVSFDEDFPEDANNTTVEDLAAWIAADPVASTYFELQHTPPSDGGGPLIPSTEFKQSEQGVDGGAVLSTAEQVANLINTASELKNLDGTGRVSAVIPPDSTGNGVVSPFSEVAYYGSASEGNYLQFLAPEGSPSIQFVSTPGTPLSIDDKTHPPVYGHAEAKIQGLDPGTSFTLRALSPGSSDDNVGVIFRDASEESAVFDAERNAVVVSVDFSGRAEDPDRDAFSMTDLQRMVAADPFVGNRFTVVPASSFDANDPPKFDNSGYRGIDAQVGETSGGVVSNGTVLINLETDANGIVKTTANDLVQFFNDPSTEEAREILDRLEISVSNIDPTNTNLTVCTTGRSANGTGLLKPTYDPSDCVDTEGRYPTIAFSSYGSEIEADYPTATVSSQNGLDADFTITAKKAGAEYNNTTVRIMEDVSGPAAKYNSITGELTIGIPPNHPTTANEIIALINADSSLSELFTASRAPHSTGEGTIEIGDRATLTGGIKALDGRAEGSVISSNGIDAMFNVSAKRTDERFNNTEIQIVADPDGPRVSYDAQSRQLTVGIDPNDPPTAREIVDLINSTADVKDYFEASIPETSPGSTAAPTGEGTVRVGDGGTLRARSEGLSLGAGMLGAGEGENLGITFHSVEYGTGEFVSVVATRQTDFPLTDRYGNVVEKTYGTDVVAKIDGQLAIGNGRIASTATSDLDLSIWLDPSVQKGDVFGFRIDGGGALIQLGPDAISSQQARIGIKNVHSVSLGGVSGQLSQIRTGGAHNLLNDTSTAFKIIDEVTAQVAALRGRLGAFQKYQLETNAENLTDAIEIETGAMSEIKDADVAEESSALSRYQLMMQSSVAVLQQSSQAKQLLLSLLQG